MNVYRLYCFCSIQELELCAELTVRTAIVQNTVRISPFIGINKIYSKKPKNNLNCLTSKPLKIFRINKSVTTSNRVYYVLIKRVSLPNPSVRLARNELLFDLTSKLTSLYFWGKAKIYNVSTSNNVHNSNSLFSFSVFRRSKVKALTRPQNKRKRTKTKSFLI